jgi:hypothetical protein
MKMTELPLDVIGIIAFGLAGVTYIIIALLIYASKE